MSYTGWNMRWVFLLLLLFCSTAAAQPADPDAATRALRIHMHGLKLYKDGKVQQALARFRAAQAVSDNRHHLYFISRCHKDLGQLRLAHEAYEQYVRHLPAPQQPQQRRTAAQKLRVEPRCRVSVSSKPGGARVLVQGVERGETPGRGALVLELPGGKPQIEVRLAGHQSGHWAPSLEYGEPRQQTFDLRPLPATLEVVSAVPGTRVWISGKAVGQAPLKRELPPGRHLVQAEAAGYRVTSRWVALAPGEARELRLALEARAASPPPPPPAAPPDNSLFLDGALGPSYLTYRDELLPAGWSYELSVGAGYLWRAGSWGWYARGSAHYTPARDLADGASSGAHVMALAGGGGRYYPRPWLWIDAGAAVGISVLVGASEESMLFAQGEPPYTMPTEHNGAGYESLALTTRLGAGITVGPGITVAVYPVALGIIRRNQHFERGGAYFLSYNVAVAVGWQR